MIMRWRSLLVLAHLCAMPVAADHAPMFTLDSQFLAPPQGSATIGDSHGDVAVSPSGDIYISVQGGDHPGVQVCSSRGRYLRNVPNAPTDLHGFVIATASDGSPHIFGASLDGQRIVQLTLDGQLVLTISSEKIPDQYKTSRDGKLSIHLTGVAVAPDGDIYAVDGYGRDFIHRFDRAGRYIGTFGGSGEPWNFKQCHKIAIDLRFEPKRLLCTDRLHARVMHMSLDGQVLGVVAEVLRLPSALAVFKNELAVAELDGRGSILGLSGEVIALVGANDNAEEIRTNEVPPEKWQPNLFYAPHGIAYDTAGNLYVTEWSKWGRVVRGRRN